MTDTWHFLLAHSIRILTTASFLQVQWAELRHSVGWVKAFSQRLLPLLMRIQKLGLPSLPVELLLSRGWPCLSCFAAAQQPWLCPGSYCFNPDPTWTDGHSFLAWSRTYLAPVDLSGYYYTEAVPGHSLWAWC